MTPAARTPPRAPRELSEARPSGPVAAHRTHPARERARRHLVATVLSLYLLAIFEGLIRKYAAPELAKVIFFIRDPLVFYAYVHATRHRLWPRGQMFLMLSFAMAAFGVVLVVLQNATTGFEPLRLLLGAYGWRAYFLYAPLAFLIGAQFRAADLLRVASVTLVLAVPIAVLVALQFASPPGASVNVGFASEEEYQFKNIGLDAEHVRPTGPFTSTTGQGQFVTSAFAFLLALLLRPPGRRGRRLVLMCAGAAGILTCLALSGSRGTVLSCVVVGAFALALGPIGRGAAFRTKALALPTALAIAAAALYPIVFPEGFSTFATRWETAAAAESGVGGIAGRWFYGFIDFVRLIDQVPPFGWGLGYGGNASTILGAGVDGVARGQLAETDFARHMVDLGPALGVLYIVFRFALVIWLARIVLAASRRAPDPLPMVLFGYVGLVLLTGQLTGHGTINFYGWFFAGLTIAAAREARVAAAAAIAARLRRSPSPTRRAPGPVRTPAAAASLALGG